MEIYREFLKYIDIYRKRWKHVEMYRNISNYIEIDRKITILKISKIWKDIPINNLQTPEIKSDWSALKSGGGLPPPEDQRTAS